MEAYLPFRCNFRPALLPALNWKASPIGLSSSFFEPLKPAPNNTAAAAFAKRSRARTICERRQYPCTGITFILFICLRHDTWDRQEEWKHVQEGVTSTAHSSSKTKRCNSMWSFLSVHVLFFSSFHYRSWALFPPLRWSRGNDLPTGLDDRQFRQKIDFITPIY